MYVLQPHLGTLRSPLPSIYVESNACPFSLWASPPLSFRVSSLRCSHGTRPRSTRKMRSQFEMSGFDSGRVDAMEDENDLCMTLIQGVVHSTRNEPMEERLRKKKDKILHTKVGSPNPAKVMFDKKAKSISGS